MMRLRKWAVAAVVGMAAVAVSLLGAPPAFANSHNPNFAGFFGTDSGGFSTATAKITVPDITCPASGIYHYTITAEWGAGAPVFAELDVKMECVNGTASMSGEVSEGDLEGGAYKYLPLSPGDVISATFTYKSGTGVIKMAAHNTQTGKSVVVSGHTDGLTYKYMNFRLSSDQPSQPIPTFISIPFSNLTVDSAAANTAAIFEGSNLYNQADTHLLVRATAFNTAGTAFRFIFVSAT